MAGDRKAVRHHKAVIGWEVSSGFDERDVKIRLPMTKF
jgi:hypothetical protein